MPRIRWIYQAAVAIGSDPNGGGCRGGHGCLDASTTTSLPAVTARVPGTDRVAPQRRVAPFWLCLSLPIAFLAIGGSVTGILVERIYARETANWAAQSVAQDFANLITFGALLVLALLTARGSLRAYLAWLGVLGFSAYTFAIYAFTIHFGPLFLLYVAVLGLSLYTLVGGLLSIDSERVKASFGSSAPVRSTAALVTGVGALFYLLWLSAIVPATLDGTTPQELVDVGLPTNPVHVIDLAVFLPAAPARGRAALEAPDPRLRACAAGPDDDGALRRHDRLQQRGVRRARS